jgi:hypothetical protein
MLKLQKAHSNFTGEMDMADTTSTRRPKVASSVMG